MKKKLRFVCYIMICSFISTLFLPGNTVTATGTMDQSLECPKGFYVSREDKDNVIVEWKKVQDASGYEIWYATESDFGDAKVITIKNPDKTHTAILAKNISNKKDTYLHMRPTKL